MFSPLLYLIEILHQTTTATPIVPSDPRLYLIEILHQTTTVLSPSWLLRRCILSKFYIKPQQTNLLVSPLPRCILSKFYIKPQPSCPWFFFLWVVSYRNSTSNHNTMGELNAIEALYLIEILHQTTTYTAPCLL